MPQAHGAVRAKPYAGWLGNLLHRGVIGSTCARVVSVVGFLVGKPAPAMKTTFRINRLCASSSPLLGTNSLIFQFSKTTTKSNFEPSARGARVALYCSHRRGEGSRVALPPAVRTPESVPLVRRSANRFREHTEDRSAVVGEIDHASTVCDIDTVRQEEVCTEHHVDGAPISPMQIRGAGSSEQRELESSCFTTSQAAVEG
jgi:hypothetical protein